MGNSISNDNNFEKYDTTLSKSPANNPEPGAQEKLPQKKNDPNPQSQDIEKFKTSLPGKTNNGGIQVSPMTQQGFKKFVFGNGALAYQAVDSSANSGSESEYKIGRYQVQSNDSKTGWRYLGADKDQHLISQLDDASRHHDELSKTNDKGEDQLDSYEFVQSMNPNSSDSSLSSKEKQTITQGIVDSLSELHPTVPRGSIQIDKETDRVEGVNSSPSDIIEASGLDPKNYNISNTNYAGLVLDGMQKSDSKDQSQDITNKTSNINSYLTGLNDIARNLQATGSIGHLDKLLQTNESGTQASDAVKTFLSDVSAQMNNNQNNLDTSTTRENIIDAIERNVVDFSLGDGISETTGEYQGAEGAVIIANLAIKQKAEELMARGSDKEFIQEGILAREGEDAQKGYRFYKEGQQEFYKQLEAGDNAKYAMKVQGQDTAGKPTSSWKYVNDKSLIEKLDRVDSGLTKHLAEAQHRISDLPSALEGKTSQENLAYIKKHYGADLNDNDLKKLESKFAENNESSKKEIAELLASKTKNPALNRIYDLVYKEKKTQVLNPEFAQRANSYNAARTAAITKIASLYGKDTSKFNKAIEQLNLQANSPERKWADKLKMDFAMSHDKFDERILKQQQNFLKSILARPLNAKTADLLQYNLTALTGFYDIENLPGF
jgi:hypothetical protein